MQSILQLQEAGQCDAATIIYPIAISIRVIFLWNYRYH